MIERIIVTAMLVLFAGSLPAQVNDHKTLEDKKGFEYCIRYLDENRDLDFAKVLDKFGKEDWEIISVVTKQPVTIAPGKMGGPYYYVFVMKRLRGSAQKSCKAINTNLTP